MRSNYSIDKSKVAESIFRLHGNSTLRNGGTSQATRHAYMPELFLGFHLLAANVEWQISILHLNAQWFERSLKLHFRKSLSDSQWSTLIIHVQTSISIDQKKNYAETELVFLFFSASIDGYS